MLSNVWKGLGHARLWLGLAAWAGGAVTGAWADVCRAPTLLTDGSSSVANEQKFCTGPWVHRLQQDYPCNPAVGPHCQGGVLYQVNEVPNTCRNKAFGGETFAERIESTTIYGEESEYYVCEPGYPCYWESDQPMVQSQYHDCNDYRANYIIPTLQGLKATVEDPQRPITYVPSETARQVGSWTNVGPRFRTRSFQYSCVVRFQNLVTQWKLGTSRELCGFTNTVNPRQPVLLPTNQYSPAMLTLGALKQLVPAAEIRDASLIDYNQPRCTTRDEQPDGTATQAQAKYTALKDELSATSVANAVAAGYDEGTFRYTITGAIKRLYEVRGHLLTEAQRLEIEAHYRSSPEYEKALVRVEPKVDSWWYLNAPDAKLRPDNFSVRWTGTLTPRYSETYTFRTESDDHVRLWVGNTLVLDTYGANLSFQSLPGPSGTRTAIVHSGTIALSVLQTYPIKIELEEWTGQAGAVVQWQSASQPLEVIPASQVSSPADSVPTGVVAGFLAEYFDNRAFTSGVVCGNRWTPPRLPAACASHPDVVSTKATLDADLALCQRLSLGHTAAALTNPKRTFCENLAMGIGTLYEHCGEQALTAYELEYNTMILGLDDKSLAAAVASSPTSRLSAQEYLAHEAKLNAWKQKVRQQIYGGAEPGVRFQSAYAEALENLRETPHEPVAGE